ncbi:hypothetical protein BH18ACT11_BH18ACT11_03550 [soil metagenome]
MEGYRERALEELGRGVFDVLVIGGGIVGSRAAFDAARIGLRVALVDAGDFGGATSGASARLVHGGLRYLGTGGYRLVRAALRERDALASRIAPHLVRPLSFVLYVAGGGRQRSRFAAGLLAYAALDGFRGPLPRFVTPEEAALLVPQLLVENLSSPALFHEAGRLLEYSEEDSEALQQIAPGAPDLWAQVYHAVRAEWAVTAEDVIYRRTTLGLRGFDTPEVRQTVSALLGSRVRAENPPPGLMEHFLQTIEGPAPKCLDGVREFDGNGSLSLE